MNKSIVILFVFLFSLSAHASFFKEVGFDCDNHPSNTEQYIFALGEADTKSKSQSEAFLALSLEVLGVRVTDSTQSSLAVKNEKVSQEFRQDTKLYTQGDIKVDEQITLDCGSLLSKKFRTLLVFDKRPFEQKIKEKYGVSICISTWGVKALSGCQDRPTNAMIEYSINGYWQVNNSNFNEIISKKTLKENFRPELLPLNPHINATSKNKLLSHSSLVRSGQRIDLTISELEASDNNPIYLTFLYVDDDFNLTVVERANIDFYKKEKSAYFEFKNNKKNNISEYFIVVSSKQPISSMNRLDNYESKEAFSVLINEILPNISHENISVAKFNIAPEV